jgi:hypothetical protein
VLPAAAAVALFAAASFAESAPPPPPAVTVTPARARLLIGTASEIEVAIEVAGPDAATFKPVRAFATVGALELPSTAGAPGRFSARYHPPAERFPQVALLVVELANGQRRALATGRIALEGSTVVPFHTSPGASVTMRVADRIFGPVIADRQGHVDIPIEVPPGVRAGVARAIDHNAAVRETEVDLQLPPFPRVAVVAPLALEVGSFAEIAVLALEGDGAPIPAAQLTLGASDGLVHPLEPGPAGEARFLFEAPRRAGAGAVALTATVIGPAPARADLAVPLQAGPPAHLAIALSARRLVVASGETAAVAVSARDAFGNPTSAAGTQVRVDGEAWPPSLGPDGTARLSITAPATFGTKGRVDIEAALGPVRAAEQIHLTGGAPARISMTVRDARIVGDGQQATELRVHAVDRNGTPTAVPGLSWETPDGRIRHVRVPREGEYVAEYVPDRTREPHRETVTVMASLALRADASVEVTPPPVRVFAAARAGLYSNLGQTAGTAVFAEALRPFEVHRVRFQAGVTAGYLHADLGVNGLAGNPGTVDIDQVPLLAIVRGRVAIPFRLEVAADAGAGVSWAVTHIVADLKSPAPIAGVAVAPAFGVGSELSLPLRPGRLLIGLRYLWIYLGRTSQGDELQGNSAGLIGDIGYKMTF